MTHLSMTYREIWFRLAYVIVLFAGFSSSQRCFYAYNCEQYVDSITSKLSLCKTASEYCDRTAIPGSATPHSYATTTTAYRTTRTITKTIHSSTIYLSKSTATSTSYIHSTITSGSKTVTVESCKSESTCGPATFNTRNELEDACHKLLDTATPTRTVTKIRDKVTHYKTKILKKKTITRTEKYATTVVVVKTKTVPTSTFYHCASQPAPEPTCGNGGFQWAIFPINKADLNGAPNLTMWDPTVYKTRLPNNNGTSDLLGGIRVDYNDMTDDDYEEFVFGHGYVGSLLTVHHKGYIFAIQNGTYKLRIPAEIERAYAWVGDVAYAGWDRSNAGLCVENSKACDGCSGTSCLDNSVAFNAVAGQYIPFRLVWGAIVGGPKYYFDFGDFYVNIQRPDGLIFEGEYAFPDDHFYPKFYNYYLEPNYLFEFLISSDLLQFSCDSNMAPQFAEWGNET